MPWRIGEILIQKKLITWDQLHDALDEQERTKEFLGEILVKKKYITHMLLYSALAKQHKMRFVDLSQIRINHKATELVPRSIAEKYCLIPIDLRENILYLGISSPHKLWPEAELKQLTRVNEIRTVLCLPEDIMESIQNYYHS